MSGHPFHRSTSLVVLAALALVFVGCAGDAKGSAGPVTTNEVTMPKSYRFAPETIQVSAGTTVTWRNDDNFTHSVRLLGGVGEDHLVKPGERLALTFDRPGDYPYDCSLHPHDMQGKVIVTGGDAGSAGAPAGEQR